MSDRQQHLFTQSLILCVLTNITDGFVHWIWVAGFVVVWLQYLTIDWPKSRSRK